MPLSSTYVLGSGADERHRLELQHQLWRPQAQAAWSRAGLGEGMAALDLGWRQAGTAGQRLARYKVWHRGGAARVASNQLTLRGPLIETAVELPAMQTGATAMKGTNGSAGWAKPQ
jgi:hypothetical protein